MKCYFLCYYIGIFSLSILPLFQLLCLNCLRSRCKTVLSSAAENYVFSPFLVKALLRQHWWSEAQVSCSLCCWFLLNIDTHNMKRSKAAVNNFITNTALYTSERIVHISELRQYTPLEQAFTNFYVIKIPLQGNVFEICECQN